MTTLAATSGPSVYWYLTRSTGAVALLLLTGAVALGVVDVRRWSTPRWPRFGTGSDVKSTWLLWLSIACLAVVLAAVLARVIAGWPENPGARGAALAGAGVFSLFLLLWLPGGPLGSEWTRRSGTPSSLLGHSTADNRASSGHGR
jgi:MFS-type transporter involved in bile tolerance (Atg22 family)